jgi:NAD(P)-dependent dehydrogenase (short-subunit alcohol dehydrogenase family)
MTGTVLVTGATDGLGKAVSVELARAGATVLVHGRSVERAEAVAADIRAVVGQRASADLCGRPRVARTGPFSG